jgi:hypothetical protein
VRPPVRPAVSPAGRTLPGALLVVGAIVAACVGAPAGGPVLERLEGTDLACVEEPVERDESAGCRTAAGGLVVSGHTDRAQLEEAVALHLATGAGGRVVDGGQWTLVAESEPAAARAARHLDGRVVTALEEVTGGCPSEAARLARLREALEDPSWC